MTVEKFVIKRNFNWGSTRSGLLSSFLDEERPLISEIFVLDAGKEKWQWNFALITSNISS